jgi:hypothetical protein
VEFEKRSVIIGTIVEDSKTTHCQLECAKRLENGEWTPQIVIAIVLWRGGSRQSGGYFSCGLLQVQYWFFEIANFLGYAGGYVFFFLAIFEVKGNKIAIASQPGVE